MLQGGTIGSTAIAFMMAAAMAGAGPAGRVLRLLLGGPSWKPLADFSYSAYLYHEHVSTKTEQHDTPCAWGSSMMCCLAEPTRKLCETRPASSTRCSVH